MIRKMCFIALGIVLFIIACTGSVHLASKFFQSQGYPALSHLMASPAHTVDARLNNFRGSEYIMEID